MGPHDLVWKFGTEQDLHDARSILVRQEGRLDLARLQALAIELGVTEPLQRLRDEIARARR